MPLMTLGRADWFQPDSFKSWANITPKVEEMKGSIILPRHLLPLEESLSELGLCYIRSAVAKLHLRLTASVVYLLIAATLISVTAHMMPHTWLFNFIIFVVCVAFILLTLLEILQIFSFVRQSADEEMEDFLRTDEPEENIAPKENPQDD